MKIPVLNNKAEILEEMTVEPRIFGEKPNDSLVAQSVRVYLSNQRKARAKTKTRTMVTGSGFKIWKQKGTGHARHGDRKAPIFVGGGVSHGPTGSQNYRLKFNRKMAQKALAVVLSDKMKNKKVFFVKEFDFKKTKEANNFINEAKENLKLKGSTGILFSPKEKIGRIFRNIPGVIIINTSSLFTYSFLSANSLFITQMAYEDLKNRFGVEKKNDK